MRQCNQERTELYRNPGETADLDKLRQLQTW